MSSEVVARLEGVTKTFAIRDAERREWRYGTRRGRVQRFTAVDDVSLTLAPGEVVGLVGANGAGKSTVLKLLSRVMHPDRGRITLNGPIMSLLEVGAGFHPELTARENVFLNGAILGLSTTTVQRSFDDIVALAGVQRFLETPVKRFSSGMRVRLAIAVGLHLDCDAVVLDEVLSVGDAEFQRRCLQILDGMVTHQGRAALLVSHNMQTIRQACSRVLVLEHGRLAYDGPPDAAVEVYFQQVAGTAHPSQTVLTARTNPHGSNRLHLLGVRLAGASGHDLVPVTEGPLGFEVETDLAGVSGEVTLTLRLRTRESPLIASLARTLDPAEGSGRWLVSWLTPLTPLAAGQYSVGLTLTAKDGGTLDAVDDALTFTVADPAALAGSLSVGLAAGHVRLDGAWTAVPQDGGPAAPRSTP